MYYIISIGRNLYLLENVILYKTDHFLRASCLLHVGTAEAIGTTLHNAPALREPSLSNCYMGPAGARHLADGLSSKNSVVEKLDLHWNKLGDAEAGIFARVLLANQNLKSLDLSNNNIGNAGALELAVALRQNKTLDLLDLNSNQIGSNVASATLPRTTL
jgi:Ran GTPase-activating protein (RanGAP) involved in mRNA processing and transport